MRRRWDPLRDDDLFASRGDGDALRDAGMARVLEGQDLWHQRGLERIRRLPKGWEGVAEVWRFGMESEGLIPRHANSWGALTGAAQKLRLIEFTGRMEKPSDSTSHSRPTKVWRRL